MLIEKCLRNHGLNHDTNCNSTDEKSMKRKEQNKSRFKHKNDNFEKCFLSNDKSNHLTDSESDNSFKPRRILPDSLSLRNPMLNSRNDSFGHLKQSSSSSESSIRKYIGRKLSSRSQSLSIYSCSLSSISTRK